MLKTYSVIFNKLKDYVNSSRLKINFIEQFNLNSLVKEYDLYVWCESMKREYNLTKEERLAIDWIESDYCNNFFEFDNDPIQ